MLPRLSFFVRQALSALSRSIGVTTLSVVTIAVALTVLATFFVIVENLSRLAEELGRDVEISVYLDPGVSRAAAQAVGREVSDWPNVDSVRYLSSAAAMEEFRTLLADDAVLLEGLPEDLLPSSLEVRLEARPWRRAEVEALAAALAALPVADDVRYGQDNIERVNSLLSFARVVAAILAVALCLGTILIVSNTIRLTVYARRDEIEIMSLVGATDAFVRAPFVIEGAIQGVAGALVALALIFGLEEGLRVGLQSGLSYAFGAIELSFIPLELVLYVLAAGFALGVIGSLLAVGRFLRVTLA